MPATNELLQEGRYRICQPTDGSENVFEAYDTVRNTNVIVREIPVRLNKVATVSQRESLKLAFANQAKALTEIEHDALLHVQDFFSEIDRQYLVMESLDGDNLRQLLKTNKQPFPVSQVTTWADELLDALNYLHTRKPPIIHLDIRPENLKLAPSGKVKLVGVSLEGRLGPDMISPTDEGDLRYSPMEKIWPGLDAASQKVITNSYDDRSERILKEPADARSDIYSLGATLYFLITGVEPIDPLERSIEMLEGKLDPLREPTKENASIPPEISDVLMKALEIKRENRYDSAFIMRQVLQTAIERVSERERQEGLERENAAAVIEQAGEEKRVGTQAGAEGLEQQENLQKQLREAEKQRLETERLAVEAEAERQRKVEADAQRQQSEKAEAERLQREKAEAERLEKEHAGGATNSVRVPDDNLLEIPVAAEVVAYRDNAAVVDEDELAAVLEELERAEAAASLPTANARPNAEVVVDDSEEIGHDTSATPGNVEPDFDVDIFSTPTKSRFSLVAAAIGTVIVISIGGWFAMSGSSETPRPQPVVQPVQAIEPPQPEPSPSVDAIVSGQSEPETVSSANPSETEQPSAAPKAAPVAKPKKTEKSAAEKKKSVTVDDLINDN